jgi:hypothetical protein
MMHSHSAGMWSLWQKHLKTGAANQFGWSGNNLTYILEVPGWILVGILWDLFVGFPQSLQANSGMVPKIRPLPPPTSFQCFIHRHPATQHYIVFELLTASLNKLQIWITFLLLEGSAEISSLCVSPFFLLVVLWLLLFLWVFKICLHHLFQF